jgi:hypothetical protein
MTAGPTQQTGESSPECPMCHTASGSLTAQSLRAGGAWACARCGQEWTAERLDTVAAYARFAARYPPSHS